MIPLALRGDAVLRDARRLIARKRLLRLETNAAVLNQQSLQAAASGPDSLATKVDTGDFLRIVRDLRRVHSHIAALAYPVLERAAESEGHDASPAPAAATRALSE